MVLNDDGDLRSTQEIYFQTFFTMFLLSVFLCAQPLDLFRSKRNRNTKSFIFCTKDNFNVKFAENHFVRCLEFIHGIVDALKNLSVNLKSWENGIQAFFCRKNIFTECGYSNEKRFIKIVACLHDTIPTFILL